MHNFSQLGARPGTTRSRLEHRELRKYGMLEAHKSAAITELQLELVALREKELNFFVWHYSALLIVSGVFLEAALSFVLLGHPPVLGDSWQHALFQSASVCALARRSYAPPDCTIG